MPTVEQIKFKTDVCYIPSQGMLKANDSTQKLNLSEQYILTFLIENHHRPVTKEELLKVGWPDRIVTEASLFQIIRALRVKLQEKQKGDIIETLPRVGYQIRDFQRETISLSQQEQEEKAAQRNWVKPAIVVGALAVTLSSIAWFYFNQDPDIPTFQVKTETIGSNKITYIALTPTDLAELEQKADAIYQGNVEKFNKSTIKNRIIYMYKTSRGAYSVAWCRTKDNSDQCIPKTDFAYRISPEKWGEFAKLSSEQGEIFRDTPIIQTELSREPTAQVFTNYMDGSGIKSKVTHYYISKEEDGEMNYSFISFITEKNSDYHHALSIRAAAVTTEPSKSQFIATTRIDPEMYHWAYSDKDKTIDNDKSIVLNNEIGLKNKHNALNVTHTYLLYHQDYLDLMLSASRGLYWVNNSQKVTELFRSAVTKKHKE
ncbi:winged helix-turn-helix domain-containing protein [Photobacterium damselae]|uniref:winged helix-turn-helix domain-containing protein n=1 Tax=Photobacterium damselae TaxID=38293 RepID=UPI00083ACFC2|nr:winged helix-turn-helix domain-containing protein [Photobacterium damselae]KAB1505848.1 hypothetical protein FD717_017170 [Photobacterium damselae subsp. damselae]ODA23854.1 hypothetical protein A0J46_04595 [Photobacterium damselae subsp. damselae]TLS70080.1 hypothetical protein FD718_09035 [Photobacterium damselae subsp. damselae]TLS74636.1 hypothetical protein FD721_18230 [Photobacterium damselae subsp. damselae]TLS89767.1 hypothetical protein FD720_01590 [Photobacterium damselae subsp. d